MKSILTRGWSSLPIRCNIRILGIFVLSERRVRKFLELVAGGEAGRPITTYNTMSMQRGPAVDIFSFVSWQQAYKRGAVVKIKSDL